MASSQNLVGKLIGQHGKNVVGWAVDTSDPCATVEVSLFINGEHIETQKSTKHIAHHLLPGWVKAENCGFVFDVPDEQFDCKEAWVDLRLGDTPSSPRIEGAPFLAQSHFFRGIYGIVQEYSGTEISGWARDAKDPDVPLTVELVVDNELKQVRRCCLYHTCLREMGFEDGCHGFKFTIENPFELYSASSVVVRISEGAILLDLNPASCGMNPFIQHDSNNPFTAGTNNFHNSCLTKVFKRCHLG